MKRAIIASSPRGDSDEQLLREALPLDPPPEPSVQSCTACVTSPIYSRRRSTKSEKERRHGERTSKTPSASARRRRRFGGDPRVGSCGGRHRRLPARLEGGYAAGSFEDAGETCARRR